jgi:hypothetical protein
LVKTPDISTYYGEKLSIFPGPELRALHGANPR